MNKNIFIIIALILFLLIDWYAFQLLKASLVGIGENFSKIIKWIYLGFVALTWIAFLFYHYGDPDLLGKHGRIFIMTGVFITYFSKFIFVLFAIVDDIIRLFKWIIQKASSSNEAISAEGISRSSFIARLGLLAAAAPVLSMTWGIFSGAHDYRVRRLNVPIKNLPKGLQGLKIAQVSDIHAGSFWDKIAVKRGINMIAEEDADLLLFTGDLVNNKASEMYDWGTEFGSLKPKHGVFSVLGNHDYGDYVSWESPEAKAANFQELIDTHAGMNWDLLRNENRVLKINDEELAIVGVENWSAKGRFPSHGDLDKAMEGIKKETPTILLSHDPSHWKAEVIERFKSIDITLSGHTHGMQFGVEIPGFKWSPVQYLYKEWAGLYKEKDQKLYVNRGFGYLGYPGRVGISPEITILTLVSA